ncbi:MAG: TIGR04376 family protein [Leptolyngbyaceae cyanobacterium SL_7_1]|nr:TIGR04376 family protein [Leptolyngbyaceae cyanobacterium SL_7_1]
MGLFEDLSSFLEARLEEFLRDNPHLELQALEENLRDQSTEAINLLADLRLREKQLQDEVLATAEEVQRWHMRVEKARNAGRDDLLKPAEEREAALLRQGNQLWGQMEMTKQRITQTIELQRQIEQKIKEVQTRVAEAQATRAAQQATDSWQSAGWNQTYSPRDLSDPLEQSFRQWEMDEELDNLKRNLGK